MREHFPLLEKYERTWPVDDLLAQYLTNHCANLRTKTKGTTRNTTITSTGESTAGPSTVTIDPSRHSDAEDDDHPNGNQSDVFISDIEDDG